jgi:tetratricopeptide (TPR) repeat protein
MGAAAVEAGRLLALLPDDPEALGIRTRDFVRRRQLSEALSADAHWRKVAPMDLNVELSILSLMGDSATPRSQIIARCDAELAAHPKDPASWVMAAHGYLVSDNTNPQQQAELLARAAERCKSDKAYAQNGTLATALVEQFDIRGQFADALETLERWAAASTSRRASWALARRLWMGGRWAKADAAFGLPGAEMPTDVLALSEICAVRADHAEKANAIKLVMDGRPGPVAAAWRSIADWATSSVRSSNDARHLLSVLRDAGSPTSDANRESSAIWWYFAGEAQATLGETDLALSAWDRSAGSSPSWAMPLVSAVPAFLEKGRWEMALKVAAEANRRAPGNLAVAIAFAQAWAAALDANGGFDPKAGAGGRIDTLSACRVACQAGVDSRCRSSRAGCDYSAPFGSISFRIPPTGGDQPLRGSGEGWAVPGPGGAKSEIETARRATSFGGSHRRGWRGIHPGV